MNSRKLLVAIVCCLSVIGTVTAQSFEPQYIGGYPAEETAKAAFEKYDYQAAAQFYVWGYVYLNSLGLEKGLAALGGNERSFYIFDRRLQPQHRVMTGNAEVVYTLSRFVDLSKGPVVFEVPPRSRGHFFDFGQRAYADSGDVGPDKGKGGKYLVVNADYSGELPEGYFTVRVLHSDRIGYLVRTFPEAEGSLEKAVDLAKQARWYYLDEAADPPRNEIVLIGDRPFNQEWPRDEQAFEWLAEAVNMDMIPASGLPYLGNMRRLGIVKGEPFAPDARAREILKRAARGGEAIVLSMAFRNRVGVPVYDDRQYENFANNKSPIFLQPYYEEVEERAGAWHQIASNFATYTPAKPGTGQFSMTTYRDADGDPLIGSNLYRLRVPADVPVKQFWQIPVYEVATRSLIATDQGRSSLSGRDELRLNPDGSVDLYFGPEAPEGFEQNWIKTKPGEGWFTLPRLYAPLEPILDKTWRWNDFELVERGDVPPKSGGDGDVVYEGGYPTQGTADAAFDEYDYQAATQFYIWGYAYLNSLGYEKGLKRLGGDERTIYLFDKRIQPQQGLITPNDEVVYVLTPYIDLSKGPIVYEVPPRARGHVWDLGMRAYTDFGDIGPDKGKGGKYLIYSTDFKGELPEGYYEVPVEHSHLVSPGLRTFPATEGSLEAAVKHGTTARWYYLSETNNPPRNPIFLIGDRPYSQEWPKDVKAFEWLAEAFNRDKVPAAGLAHLGNMRRLGIEKGKPFSPDERAKKILERAAKTAEAIVLSMAFRPRTAPIYENRKYEQVFNNASPIFLLENYEEVEARAGGWHQLVGNFVIRVPAKPGTGQFNMVAYRDSDGNFLTGEHTYRLRVPADVPVKQFWQIPVYEVATRAMMNTDQKKSALSGNDDLRRNADGSVDLYFGPEAPEGYEKNWIKTKPGEGWFTLPRLYAPLEPILDKSWRWNDIEKVKSQPGRTQ